MKSPIPLSWGVARRDVSDRSPREESVPDEQTSLGSAAGCSDCPPGSISPNGTHCANCLRGRYQPLPGMGLCEIAEVRLTPLPGHAWLSFPYVWVSC
jgi:hypothetical protein